MSSAICFIVAYLIHSRMCVCVCLMWCDRRSYYILQHLVAILYAILNLMYTNRMMLHTTIRLLGYINAYGYVRSRIIEHFYLRQHITIWALHFLRYFVCHSSPSRPNNTYICVRACAFVHVDVQRAYAVMTNFRRFPLEYLNNARDENSYA